MPLKNKAKIKRAMKKTYGNNTGEQVFYAYVNKKTKKHKKKG